MKLTNRWNRFIYSVWAPIYDAALARFFLPGRVRAMELLELEPGERVLIVGVGSGMDLPLLPEGVSAVGVDLSPAMLRRAKARLPLPGRDVVLVQGDAQVLQVPEASCEAVIFNLILSVVPDGQACLRENMHALKTGGRAVVFDKFAPEDRGLSPMRRMMNWFSTLLGTDITRRFSDMLEGSGTCILHQEGSLLGGMYQVFLLRKRTNLP
jgi:phosphatidylethanolamine/phosphatidyl-N-methylethanolamine N-methyltransferase